ncbi:hypothetical protein IAR55_001994 [Kwoniella newhampshirensis]|uniref:Zn(2)-C6 fungal-type domain-containing protein n=1 Tax=Kwoniella newhampshirensis TaxID=1651941 RepID=A0AAW0Z3L2_9TREE
MPTKRRNIDTEDGSHSPPQRARRQVSHVSRACDGCRRRKMRCDGGHPRCAACEDRDAACEYNDEDRRKTNMEHLQDMNARMDRFEHLIENLIQAIPGAAVPTSQTAIPTNAPNAATIDPRVQLSPTTQVGMHHVSPTTSTARPASHPASTSQASPRVEEAAGVLVQFGPTSFWTHKSSRPYQASTPFAYDRRPGDRVEWSRNLPPSLLISRSVHDQALGYFGAFYAPWCFIVDMPAFLNDLTLCNLVGPTDNGRPAPPVRTASYSPLLHCCVLFLGLTLIRDEHPTLMRSLESVFLQHCSSLLLVECEHTALSSLRAYNLFANRLSCTHAMRVSPPGRASSPGERQSTSGYLYSAMAIGGVHALGLNINVSHITNKERNLRDSAYWTVFIQDSLRAIAAGRQPLLVQSDIPFPTIDQEVDDVPWIAPPMISCSTHAARPGANINGWKSMRSTTLHWSARLAVLSCTVLEALYSPRGNGSKTEEAAVDLSQRLELWYAQFPLRPPEATPLPHVLLLHMIYNLLTIFVHRPFYRSSLSSSSEKCDQAARSILHLLQLFDNIHGVRFAHHNISKLTPSLTELIVQVNVIFGAATIFLLRCVGSPSDDAEPTSDMQGYQQCVDFMAAASVTWVEAGIARDVLLSLHTEYNAGPCSSADAVPTQFSPGPFVNDFPDWLTSTDVWGSMFLDTSNQWGTFSLIDSRPLFAMSTVCQKYKIHLLTYGSFCGGFLSDRWLDRGAPDGYGEKVPLTPSQRKYFDMIYTWGSWKKFSYLLSVLRHIALSHNGAIANVATRWVLQRPEVGAVIVRTRLDVSSNLEMNLKAFTFELSSDEIETIESQPWARVERRRYGFMRRLVIVDKSIDRFEKGVSL